MRKLAILGSTGSIGTQALDVAARHSDRFAVTALVAHSSSEKLFEQVRQFHPKIAALSVEPKEIPADIKNSCQWMFGENVLLDVVHACDADDVLVSVVGVVGLAAVMETLACGISVQEFSMGMGPLIAKWKSRKGTQFSIRLLPIGGYCQFYGEDDEKNDPRAFNNQPVWKRAITVFNGPLMNFVIAFLVIALFMSAIGVNAVVPKVAQVEETAQAAGLQIGDEITAVNGETVATSDAIAKAISASGGEAVTLTVKRDGRTLDLTLTPFYDEQAGRYRVGFSFGQERVRVSVFESIPFSLQYNVESVRLILSTLKNLVFKGQGVDDVTGPVGTVYVIQEVTQQGGFEVYLELLALISVNLGVMNLLPIPGLDGSRLLFLLAEAIRRKPVKRELEGAIHAAGFILLMGLMVLLTYKDIMRFFVKG